MNWLRRHAQRYRGRGPWSFAWRIGVESTLVSLAVSAALTLVFEDPARELLDLPFMVAFVAIMLVAPPLETLLLQALPIFVVRRLKGSFRTQVLVSTILFSAMHFPEGIVTGVAAGVIGGLYFASAYAFWRTRSRWSAFWVTTVAHAVHNGIALALLVLFGNWS